MAALAPPAAAEEIGDAERGAEIWLKCSSCHAIGPEAEHKTGPHLNELFGRRAASFEAFKYSKAMRRAGADGLTWERETLEIYIENPKSLVSKTTMRFRGVKDPGDRADLIAFLRIYSANPRDIPESAPTALPTDPDVAPEILAIKGDAAYGEYLSSECKTCHLADGADEGIPSIVGWRAEDFVIAMQAYKVKARPHPVMQMMAGRLSDEEIAGLAAYFEGVEE
ncbi:MAG: c-type cytochrome [Pseudomonadota bacterium]